MAAMQPPSSLPIPPKPVGASTSAPDNAYSAATISSGPQPASLYPPQPAPVMLPPLHYQGLDAAQPFGYQPPPPGGRVPAYSPPGTGLGAGGTPPIAGVVRGAEEMEGGAEDIPPAKRQRVAKLPGGQLYPEQDWINMHPVRCLFFLSFIVLKACLLVYTTFRNCVGFVTDVFNIRRNSIRSCCKSSCRRTRRGQSSS
jgi:hypothetical protein